MIDGFMGFMAVSGKNHPGPISFGNPRNFTIRQLSEIVIEMIGSSSKLDFRALPANDPKQRQPNISRARELLEWCSQPTSSAVCAR